MRIFDCFMYFDEDLILDARLNILDKYVDFFIIVESKYNHKGEKRSLKLDLEKFKKFKNIEILWASTRETYNFLEAKELGCQIITVPPKIIETIESFGKSFEKLTKDTVKGFLIDSKKSRFKI